MFASIKEGLKIYPKRIFLVDSLGALFTAFLLFVVLKSYDECFGMPKNILNYLSAIALLYFFYSFACYTLTIKHWAKFLRIIITANLFYVLLTLSLIIYYLKQLTILGITYFVLEIIVIIALVSIEIRILTTQELEKNKLK